MITEESFLGYPADGRVRLVSALTDTAGFYVCDNDPIYAAISGKEQHRNTVETACLHLNLAAKLKLVNESNDDGKEETFDIIRLASFSESRELVSFIELCTMHAIGNSTLSFEDFFYSLVELFQPNKTESKLKARGLYAELSVIESFSKSENDIDLSEYWQVLGSRSKYDFVLRRCNIEVKSIASEQNEVLIKHFQLFNNDKNYLIVVAIEKNPSGKTLRELSTGLITRKDCFNTLKARLELEARLLAVSEKDLDIPYAVYSSRCYSADTINPFEKIPDRVSELQYRLNLDDINYLDPILVIRNMLVAD